VKAARAAISNGPGTAEVLRQDWVKAAHFYARFGITETMFRTGVPASESAPEGETPGEGFDVIYLLGGKPLAE